MENLDSTSRDDENVTILGHSRCRTSHRRYGIHAVFESIFVIRSALKHKVQASLYSEYYSRVDTSPQMITCVVLRACC